MNGKTEKTRGAKVRASRAKSRVEAKKKSRTAARDPGRGSETSVRAERGSSGRRAATGLKPPVPAADKKTEPEGGKKRRRKKTAAGRDGVPVMGKPVSGPPAPGGQGRKEKRERSEAAVPAGARTVGKAVDPGVDSPAARQDEKRKRVVPMKGRGGSPARTVALGVLLVISLAAMLWVYTATDVLNVKQVELRGNEKLQAAYLRSLSGITGDTHLLKMDVKAVESALLSEPYVATADVSRHYPNTVVIEIVERRPSGFIFQNGKYALVDQEGMVLESADAAPVGLVEIKDLVLPLLLPGTEISGIEFAAVTSLIGSLPQALREKTVAVGLKGDDGLYITAGGTTVIYGEAVDLSRKSAIALMALSVLLPRHGAVEYIDVSFPEHPVIKPYAAA